MHQDTQFIQASLLQALIQLFHLNRVRERSLMLAEKMIRLPLSYFSIFSNHFSFPQNSVGDYPVGFVQGDVVKVSGEMTYETSYQAYVMNVTNITHSPIQRFQLRLLYLFSRQQQTLRQFLLMQKILMEVTVAIICR